MTTLQDVYNLNKLNCTTIEGPLFIENLDPEGVRELYSLDTVEQITQFLVVQRIRANYTCLNQLLPRLRVIRGNRLYENKWTLVMRDNVQFFLDPEQQDMLSNTSEQLNRKFDFYHQSLLPDTGQFCSISQFKEPLSGLCTESPNLYLDTEGLCQAFCRSNSSVVKEDWRCDKGCGNLSVPRFYWQLGKAGIERVPGMKSSRFATCLVPCRAPEGVISDISELQYLQHCGVLHGNLQLSLSVSSVDMFFLEYYLGSLEEITGYLLVFRSWGMDSLQFLSNLTKLNTQKRLWQGRYSMAFYDNPDLSRLWNGVGSLNATGDVYLHGNPRMCSMDVEALNQSFSGRVYGDMALYTADTCSPWQPCINRISPPGQRLHWNSTLNNTSFVGYIIYSTSYNTLMEMSTQANSHLFQKWMTERGSPGNLRGWQVIQTNGSVLISQNGQDDDQLFHIRAFRMSANQLELRSEVCIQLSNSMDNKSSEDGLLLHYHQGLSNEQSFMISSYSNCCMGNDHPNVKVEWEPISEAVQVEVEYMEKEIDWTSKENPFMNHTSLLKTMCYASCPILSIPPTDIDQPIPSEVSVAEKAVCKSSNCSICSNFSHIYLEDLKPFTAYAVRIRKRFSKESSATCDLWSPPVLLLTAPSEKNDLVRNLTVKEDGHDDDYITFSWQRPLLPNGQISHFCVAIMSNIQLDLSDVKFGWIDKDANKEDPSCIESMGHLLSRELRTWAAVKMKMMDNSENFFVELHIPEEPENQGENITCLVQTISQIKWTRGKASVTTRYYVNPELEKGSKKEWIIAVSVCCVFICVLVPLLILSVRYGRRKRKKANMLENQIYFMNSHAIEYGELSPTEVYIPDEWEVDKACVTMHNALGEGAFGKVFAGTLTVGKDKHDVAVKTLKDGAALAERLLFLTESSMMKKLDSGNIVKLLGIVSKSDPVLVVMELMVNGDLKHYLQSIRPNEGRNEDGAYCSYPLTEDELVQLAIQIAAGMDYLHEKSFVHRDLAARNCMVAADPRVVKIGDFGMARNLYSTDYYIKHGRGPMPIRWMAPESLQDGIFTYSTDVWSYAVVLWEMVTLGCQPYPGKTNQEVFDFVSKGYRMDVKLLPHCPTIFMMLMERCWRTQPQHRPDFHKILAVISMDHGEELKI